MGSFLGRALFALTCWSLSITASIAAPDDVAFFESKIRPVFASQCFSCHTSSALGGLRVDSKEALLKGGKSGPAIVPGDPDNSLLIKAVRHTGTLKMPMGGKLDPKQIEDLAAWVKNGAFWPAELKPTTNTGGKYTITAQQRAFWSFQPLKAPAVPAPKNTKWARTDIDRFILARLEKEGLTPAAPADRRTLLRRASLDLTGLPPTFEETQAFLNDKSPDAFAKVVDRLLASPHYGERWARMWLDVARYGEDDYRSLDPMGRGFNPYSMAYLYRDWVIQSFNDDLPYDQFVKAQLAADLMPENQRVRMLPALGFLGQGPWFYDNGAVEITQADARHDRIDVVSRGFLGLTAGCARCHNHKYDPIPQTDYYALGGVFASIDYHEYPRVPKEVAAEYDRQEQTLKAKQRMLAKFQHEESEHLSQRLTMEAAKYMIAVWHITGEPKEKFTKVLDSNKLDYELLERWVKFLSRPPKYYPFLKDWQAMMARGGTEQEARKLAEEFQNLLMSVLIEHKEVDDENEVRLTKALPGLKKREPVFKPSDFKTNDDFCPGCGVELRAMPPERAKLWADVYKEDLDEPGLPGIFDNKPGLLLFRGWGLERQLDADKRAYVNAMKADLEKAEKALGPHYPYVHGVTEEPQPVNLKVNLRGNPFSLGEEVPRGFLSVLSPAEGPVRFTKGSGRMELAEAILAQPVAMRVIANRIWKAHFGTGIVDSPSNFGVTGERPVHPELLDYLAIYFRDHGLSFKQLHREILLSSVYQLSNEFQQAAFEKDAANRLYWRFNRRRMDAEQIRDSLLATSGQLDKKLYGPSEALTPDYARRTVYGKISRYRLDDYLQLFDFPSPNITAEQRFTTNVPLQRLFFMNSDFVQQQAEQIVRKVEDETSSEARIRKLYRVALGREATPEEVRLGIEYISQEPLKAYDERTAAVASSKDKDKGPKPVEKAEAAAEPGMDSNGMMSGVATPRKPETRKKPMLPVTTWGRYAKVLLSSTEFVFID
jgi:mono/diheme cytochrome c family protein